METGDLHPDGGAAHVADEGAASGSGSPEGSPPQMLVKTLSDPQTLAKTLNKRLNPEEDEGLPWAGEGSESPVAVEQAVQGGTVQSTAGHDGAASGEASSGDGAGESGGASDEGGVGDELESGEMKTDGGPEAGSPGEVPYSPTRHAGSEGGGSPTGFARLVDLEVEQPESGATAAEYGGSPGVVPDQATSEGEPQAGTRLPLLQLKLSSGAGRGRVLAQNALELPPESRVEAAGPRPAGAARAEAADAAPAPAGGTGGRALPAGGTPLLVKANRSVMPVPKARSSEVSSFPSSLLLPTPERLLERSPEC